MPTLDAKTRVTAPVDGSMTPVMPRLSIIVTEPPAARGAVPDAMGNPVAMLHAAVGTATPAARVNLLMTGVVPAVPEFATNMVSSLCNQRPDDVAVATRPVSDNEFAYTPVGVLVEELVPRMAMLLLRTAYTNPL